MAQHFLLSSRSRGLSLGTIFGMSEKDADQLFAEARWPKTGGDPVCPWCGCRRCWRFSERRRFRCSSCRRDFSVTSGTVFHARKLPLGTLLAAVFLFVTGVKGLAGLHLTRVINISYKTSFVLEHKLREAKLVETHNLIIGGPGKVVEIDGCYIGGHIRPANYKKNRRDRRFACHQTGKRRVLIVLREQGGRTIVHVVPKEDAAIGFIRDRVARGSVLMVDEAPSWTGLDLWFEVFRINHQEAYSDGTACTNHAESFFSRVRRGEWGVHHVLSGPYLSSYGAEMAWREDHRRESVAALFRRLVELAARGRPSRRFRGYWQRARKLRDKRN